MRSVERGKPAPDPFLKAAERLGVEPRLCLALEDSYVEFDVPVGKAKGIARFYEVLFGAQTKLEGNGSGKVAHVTVGHHQELRFREMRKAQKPYDGHHTQVYVQDFSGPYKELMKRELLTEESNAYQYRFEHLVDIDSNKTLFEIEHEICSMTHPLYGRPLVNRNPAQSQQSYQMGGDDWDWEIRRSTGLSPINTLCAQALKERQAQRIAKGM